MYYDVKSARYCDGYKIQLSFADGKWGVVDFQPYLQKGGVFEKFKDLNFFKNFHINEEVGVLSWENDIDIAPETVYFTATKLPMPGWVA